MVAPRQIAATDIFSSSGAFAISPTIAGLGDSITANNGGGNKNAIGFLDWAAVLSRQRVSFDASLNFGVAGQTSAQILARVGAVVSAAPTFCTVLAGTNDTSLTAAQTIANLDAIYAALQQAGIIVIAIPITPRSTGTTAQRLHMVQVNDWIRRRRFTLKNLHVLDATQIYGDSAWTPRANYASDGLHPTVLGAYRIGKALAALITTLIPCEPAIAVNSLDIFDATDNPRGNLASNGILSGTAGTFPAGFTGALADNTFVNTNTLLGSSVVLSKSTLADGRVAQRVQWSGSFTGGTATFQLATNVASASTKVLTGDKVEAWVEIEAAAGAAAHVELALYTVWAAGNNTALELQHTSADAPPDEAWSGILRTPAFVMPDAATTISLIVQFFSYGTSGTVAGDFKIGPGKICKVLP